MMNDAGGGNQAGRDDQAEALREKEAFNFALFQYNPTPSVIPANP